MQSSIFIRSETKMKHEILNLPWVLKHMALKYPDPNLFLHSINSGSVLDSEVRVLWGMKSEGLEKMGIS